MLEQQKIPEDAGNIWPAMQSLVMRDGRVYDLANVL